MPVDYRTESVLECFESFNTPICHTRTKSIPILQMYFICTRQHSYELKNKKGSWMVLSESRQRQITQNVQKIFPVSDLAQQEEQLTGKADNAIPQTTRKLERWFWRDNVEGEDIIAVPMSLAKSFRKKQVLVSRIASTRKTNTSKAGNEEQDEDDDHARGEKNFADKQADVLPSGIKEQVPFAENVS